MWWKHGRRMIRCGGRMMPPSKKESGRRGTSRYKGYSIATTSGRLFWYQPLNLWLKQKKQQDLLAWHGGDGASSVPAQEPRYGNTYDITSETPQPEQVHTYLQTLEVPANKRCFNSSLRNQPNKSRPRATSQKHTVSYSVAPEGFVLRLPRHTPNDIIDSPKARRNRFQGL